MALSIYTGAHLVKRNLFKALTEGFGCPYERQAINRSK
jgi:hypothetical protein